MTDTAKAAALAKHLGVDLDTVCYASGNFASTDAPGEYSVMTDAEADAAAREYILDSAWAFNHSFLCAHSKAIDAIPEKAYTEIAGKLCEGFNPAVLAMIDDKDHFVNEAIKADGRGHFLSQYDSEESEEGDFYIYRTN
jgi:hypothetical protein